MHEAHFAVHLNQATAFEGVIPKDEGWCITLPASSYAEFQRGLEEFWEPYRTADPARDGRPTCQAYNQALYEALRIAGYTESEARFLAARARMELLLYGLLDSHPVPVVPSPRNPKSEEDIAPHANVETAVNLWAKDEQEPHQVGSRFFAFLPPLHRLGVGFFHARGKVRKRQWLPTLAQLEALEWFHAVGQHDTKAATVLSSWQEAVSSARSIEWIRTQEVVARRLRQEIQRRKPDRYAEWNSLAAETKQQIRSLTRRQLQRLELDEASIFPLRRSIEWDLTHFAVECAHADLVPPGFYTGLVEWYLKGHLPCGWNGAFPAGMLIIF